jgi:dihydroorotase
MNKILIKQAVIIDPASEWHEKRADVLIENGIIAKVGKVNADEDAEIIEAGNYYLSPGWVDMRASFWDPGHEYKEDIHTGADTAAYGGFTAVAILPETEPRIATKAIVEYVISKGRHHVVEILPLAAISQTKEGQDLTEMYDLVNAGAVGFSSGFKSVEDNGFLLRASQYGSELGKPVMVLAENKNIAGKGQVNEGLMSVQLGLKGNPAIAEETEVSTLLEVCRYTGAKMHFSCISTARSAELIVQARKEGLEITADISIHHLYFNENELINFDTNFKLRPPLRTERDQLALQKMLLEHDFFAVVSNHTPHEEDKKKCEFEMAAFGASALQTVFSQMLDIYGWQNIDKIVDILAYRPCRIMGMPAVSVKEGQYAALTLFDPERKWILNNDSNRSKAVNHPLWGKELAGKAMAIINKGRLKALQ